MSNPLHTVINVINTVLRRSPQTPQAIVEIYTWQTCPYCIRAKLLLWWKGVAFREYKIDGDAPARAAMAERAQGRRSVPQIFINDQHIGGCDDLYALNTSGKLDPLLASVPAKIQDSAIH
jgi:glutaredoxin 3